MINTLHKELRAIALSILDQGNTVNVGELEQKVRELQKQLTILEHEQRMSKQEVVEVPLAVVEDSKLEMKNQKWLLKQFLKSSLKR